MADYGRRQDADMAKESAIQAINTIIQLHFEKTLEKKRSIEQQKKELWRIFSALFIFLGLLFVAISLSPRILCRHCWAPIGLLSLAHLVFYVGIAQTLKCINGYKYQRRCHKLTLAAATDRLRRLRGREGFGDEWEVEIEYQEPPESYVEKFRTKWVMHFGFLILVYAFMVSSSVIILCY